MKKIIYLVTMFFAFTALMPAGALSLDKGQDVIIRVAIVDNKDSIHLALKGKYKIYAINSENVLMESPYLAATVRATKDGLLIGTKEIKGYGVKVKVARDSNIYVDNRRFRGDIDIIRKENSKLTVINYIGLEDYLYGVLYHEVSHRWPLECLKAQAIAARTFALYQARQNKLQPYDLRSDIYSQVYGGRTSEKWSTNRAVDVTKGRVLTYKGDIFPTYYHATCAGQTEDSTNLWNVDMPPLDGAGCGFCGQSKHYTWKKDIPLWEVGNKLADNGYKIGEIESVAVLSRNISGRVDKIEIKDKKGVSCILAAKDFRQMFGPNEIRSTKFDVKVKWGHAIIEGFGWGHGVGMCQWGAYGMAQKGKTVEQILQNYYPGTEIMSIENLKDKL